ncbi:tryptophan synthase subunit alpha [Sphingomonas sp. LY160]|uniref:tryptophan synthase subunit alpha n=1 Tax=Sphingomonas sp. LY160 TaxID=3095342 RepID=UPI002ADECCD3|nr:tryptophan synthase subunit alpha [Sphingomonas sp. LY160]MEA1072886.1 tryptophan synthase subunit alpha [Sphingomonas sp. LY160]
MSRYAAMFDRCSKVGDGALGAFLMLGDPGPNEGGAYLDALVEGGADMVEFGIPFSDPVADGPVIQAAAQRALAAGVRTADCLRMLGDFRSRHADVPVGVLTYANIVSARGIDRFCEELVEAGVDSLLVADVPSIEAAPYAKAARKAGLDLVMIAAPNTAAEVWQRIASLSSGYTYCVARAGVTGVDQQLALDHDALFAGLASAGAPPPVLGFGIASPEHVRQAIEAGAAGAISGSAIVKLVGEGRPPKEISQFVATLKRGTTGAARR